MTLGRLYVNRPYLYPYQAWVLDATPGKVRAGGDGEDHPRELISFLRKLPKVVSYEVYRYFVLFHHEKSSVPFH